jgi:hypothetical protein
MPNEAGTVSKAPPPRRKIGGVIVFVELAPVLEFGTREQTEHVPARIVRIGFVAGAHNGLLEPP